MAITFSIPNTEVIVTSGQTSVTAQDLINAIREFEDDFVMMSTPKIADASGKFPVGGVFSEIILTLLDPWTIRFEDEASAHTSVTGGTFLATDAVGAGRPVTTNFSLTINQSISGVLVETGVSGLTAAESATLMGMNKPKKNTAFPDFQFVMLNSNGKLTSGLTVSGQRCIDNAAWAPIENTPSEVAGGLYRVDLHANDTNGAIISYMFSATGAEPTIITVVTSE